MTSAAAQVAPSTSPKEEAEALMARVMGHEWRDPLWRIRNIYWIIDERGQRVRFVPNEEQWDFVTHLWYRNIILKARQLGFCGAPWTRVLTADLRWVTLDEIPVGTEIIAVDEHIPGGRGAGRKMRTGIVEAKREVFEPALRLRMSNGEALVLTAEHRMLCRRRGGDEMVWRKVADMRPGDEIRFVAKPWGESTREDYWFGGILDGEGSFATNGSPSVNASQREGAVWQRMLRYVRERGYNFCVESDTAERPNKHGKVPVPKVVIGRMNEMFQLLGQCRPTRFLDRRWWEGRDLPGKRTGDATASIVSIELLPAQRMIDLQTSTKTFIAEGFVSHNSTLMALLELDQAIFRANYNGSIISDTLPNAGKLFGKVEYAYKNLPDVLRMAAPLKGHEAKSFMTFAHERGESTVTVSVSDRGGTVQLLHVSELGKISRRFPLRAQEIVSGAFPAAEAGVIVVESTAEGAAGEFWDLCEPALKRLAAGLPETRLDYRLHFYPWFKKAAYRLSDEDTRLVHIPEARVRYFRELEAKLGIVVDANQRAWYVKTEEIQKKKMKREYPSTPEEAFEAAVEGAIYGDEMATVREHGRITSVPLDPTYPVNTFWDLGTANTFVWLHQHIGFQHRFIKTFGDPKAPPKAIGRWWRDLEQWRLEQPSRFLWGKHYMPHDADTDVPTEDGTLTTTKELFEKAASGQKVIVVPRIANLGDGIEITRRVLDVNCWFDKEGTAEGVRALDNYQNEWDDIRERYKDNPLKNWACHGADSYRQFAQALDAKLIDNAEIGPSLKAFKARARTWH